MTCNGFAALLVFVFMLICLLALLVIYLIEKLD